MTQEEEIARICERMGISRDELADKVPLNRETLRKIANGYQKASEITMNSIRNAEKMASLFKDAALGNAGSDSPYRYVQLETLEKILSDQVIHLNKAHAHERKHIIGNLAEVIAELEKREIQTVPAPDDLLEPERPSVEKAAGNALKKGARSVREGTNSGKKYLTKKEAEDQILAEMRRSAGLEDDVH